MKQIVVLIRDLDQQEILEVNEELEKENPILTNRYFYPIRDEHYDEDEEYCNDKTNGDIFTDDPDIDILYNFIESNYPTLFEQFIKNWKAINGHDASK